MFTDIYNGKVIIQIKEVETIGVVIDSLIEKDTQRVIGHEILVGDEKQWETLRDLIFRE